MRARLVAGNWKMHGSLASNARLLDALKAGLKHAEGVDCAVCAPFPYLAQVSAALSGSRIAWGAQDVCEHDAGAYTGEVSGAMLKEFGCRFAIVGHSERRSLYAEDDSRVAAKFIAAQRVTIMYGGSVKPGNAAELFAMPDIDGGLIGGASLAAEDLIAICAAAQG